MVEFTGLPGSGKSTLAHAVADRLRRERESISEPSYQLNHHCSRWHRVLTKVVCILRCAIADPHGSLGAVVSIARTRQRSWNDLLNTTFNMLYVCGLRRAVSKRPGIHILDQGFFQQLWSIRFSASRPLSPLGFDQLGRGCFDDAAGGAVVFVDVRPKTAVERLAARQGAASRLERRLSRETQRTDLAAAEEALAETRNAVQVIVGARSDVRVTNLTNEDAEDVEAKAEEIARQLHAWTTAPPSGARDVG